MFKTLFVTSYFYAKSNPFLSLSDFLAFLFVAICLKLFCLGSKRIKLLTFISLFSSHILSSICYSYLLYQVIDQKPIQDTDQKKKLIEQITSTQNLYSFCNNPKYLILLIQINFNMPLTLYYLPGSQPSRSVQALLHLLEIKYEKKEVDLPRQEQKTPEYLAINPMGTIPAIDDDGFKLWESEAIMKYLISSRKVGDSYYPSEPKVRAMIDRYFPYHHHTFRPKLTKYFHLQYHFLFPHENFDNKEQIVKEAEGVLKTFEDIFLKDNKYISGDSLTIADLLAVNELTQVYYTTEFDFTKYPRIKEYIERCLENPVILEVNQEIKKFPEVIKNYLASLKKNEA